MNFNEMLGWIITFNAAIVAIGSIYVKAKQPFISTRKKREEEMKRHDEALLSNVKVLLDERIPEILLEHDLQVRDRYRSDREKYLQDVAKEVGEKYSGTLQEIRGINEAQNENIQAIGICLKNLLRVRIVDIYNTHKDTGKMSKLDKEALDTYYKDYKKLGGNSFIDRIYNIMKEWEVIKESDVEDILL